MSKRFGSPGPRVLDPDLCTSPALGACAIGAQLLFDRLILQADDQGRLLGSVVMVRSRCLPMVETATPRRVESWIADLAACGLIQKYTADETELIQIVGWWDDQAGMRRAYASKWSAPGGWEDRVYGVTEDNRPGTLAVRAAKANPAGKVQRSAADCGEITAPACASADASADASAEESAAAPPSASTLDWQNEIRGGPLDTDEFRTAFAGWLAHRVELRVKPYKSRALKGCLSELASMGSAGAVEAIRHSIAKNYQGIYPPGGNGHSQARRPTPPPPPTVSDDPHFKNPWLNVENRGHAAGEREIS